MTEVDEDAMLRAIEQYRKLGAEQNERIDRKFADGLTFEEVGASAAYRCQFINLGLKPWQISPMCGDTHPPQYAGTADAAALLRKLLDAGLSRYEPDPAKALAAAKKPAA